MDVKEAVKKALVYLIELFQNEKLNNVGLEEVVLNEEEDVWEITVGFSRPWDYPPGGSEADFWEPQSPKREYKVIKVDNSSGEIKSIKIREIKNA